MVSVGTPMLMLSMLLDVVSWASTPEVAEVVAGTPMEIESGAEEVVAGTPMEIESGEEDVVAGTPMEIESGEEEVVAGTPMEIESAGLLLVLLPLPGIPLLKPSPSVHVGVAAVGPADDVSFWAGK
ncbi:hypothetical protein PG993_004557 [Apiospora rasikravindrae]|uniref:Secreted protein n=1 Tax=Apiospora rasikravindrae TaxID=990691 RepID=A0ABR1TD35_9PEZI